MSLFFNFQWTTIAFYVITILWILEFRVFPSKYEGKDYKEKRSFRIILFGIVSIISLTIILAYFDALIFDIYYIRIIGLTLYMARLLLRYTSSYKLGKYFTRDVEVASDQELVSTGPYRLLRHPLYLGLFLLTIAVPVFWQSPIAILLGIVVMGYTLNKRMRIEEYNMEQVLGNTYKEWKAKRYRFIPFIY